jgi:hypothetical protein
MTAAFLDKLELEYIDGRNWRVTHLFRYRTAAGTQIAVPRDFVTDFASIPRGLWNLLPPTSSCGQASVIHDFAYTRQFCTRADADALLLEAMGVIGVGRLKRYTIYTAVRLGGGGIWKRHTAELEEAERRTRALRADDPDPAA